MRRREKREIRSSSKTGVKPLSFPHALPRIFRVQQADSKRAEIIKSYYLLSDTTFT